MDINKAIIVGIFGNMKASLLDTGLLSNRGKPIKAVNLAMEDAFYLYETFGKLSLTTNIVDKDYYNKIVNSFNGDYVADRLIISLKLAEFYIEDNFDHVSKTLCIPKIDRLYVDSRKGLTAKLIKESMQVASNIYRRLHNKEELTQENRENIVKSWAL